MKNQYKLFQRIIELSYSPIWEEAKEEWRTKQIYMSDEPMECICGKFPIKEVIILENFITKKMAVIGNCCINKFFGIKDYNKMFGAIRKNKLNKALIEHASKMNWINSKEEKFALDVWRKRKLSVKQKAWLDAIKNKIINKLGGSE